MSDYVDYVPTAHERRILDALLDPENRFKSQVEIVKLAQTSEQTYYKAWRKQGFRELYQKMSIELVKHAVGPVVNAVVKEAKGGSFQHAKLILEMAGMHSDKKRIEGQIDSNVETTLHIIIDGLEEEPEDDE